MTVREIDKEVLKKARRLFKLQGQQRKAQEAIGVNKNFTTDVKKGLKKTATEPIADKFEDYIKSL